MLHIRLLGEFCLSDGDTPVTAINTARLQSLLAYLLLHHKAPQARRHLAFLLWPDSPESQAIANLRNLIHRLRQGLPSAANLIQADANTVQWRADVPYALDVAEFESALAARRWQDAVTLYTGDLLPGCYDEWIVPERERLQQLYLDALEKLILKLETDHDYVTAISHARQLMQRDPLREETCRLLMRLHEQNGDCAAALHVYHTCATTLQQELGVEPGPPTREIYTRLLSATVHSPLPRLTASVTPLVGRDREWAALRLAWKRAAYTPGQPQWALIKGEAGIGKTRLAEEMIAWTSRQRVTALIGHGYPVENRLAYMPIVEWLRAQPLPDLDEVWLTELGRLLPELLVDRPTLPRPEPMREDWQRLRFFQAIAHALLDRVSPVLLTIEDVQWVDHETLDWLHYFLHNTFDDAPRLPVLMLTTLRSEEQDHNPSIESLVTSLRRLERLTEFELGPLSHADTVKLATHLLGQELDAEQDDWLFRSSEGYPLFVVELAQAGLAEFAPSSSRARRSPHLLPPKLQNVIHARLGQLSPAAHDLAGLAATIGREFTFDVLAQASGSDEETLVRGLDELWRRRILRERDAAGYDFSHDKIRETIYAELSAARRRLFHRRVAQALEAVYANDMDAVSGQVASHYEQAGLADKAILSYRQAAEAARRVYANQEAMALFRRGLALLESKAGDSQRQAAAQFYEGLGDVLELVGQHDQARDTLQCALKQLASDAIGQVRLHQSIGKTWLAQSHFEEAARAFDIAETALGPIPSEPTRAWWQAWTDIQLARLDMYYWRNQWREMGELAGHIRPRVEQYGRPEQHIYFLHNLDLMAWRRDRYVISEETLTDCRTLMTLCREPGSRRDQASAPFWMGFALLFHGDLDAAVESLQTSLALAERIGDVTLQVRCLTYLTLAHRRSRNMEQTRQYALASLVIATTMRMTDYVGAAKANLAWLAWRASNLSEAHENGQAAMQAWQSAAFPYAFQWTALWPLMGVALAQRQLSQAMDFARALLDLWQQRLPDSLTALLEKAIQAWEQNQPEAALAYLHQTVEPAQDMGYL